MCQPLELTKLLSTFVETLLMAVVNFNRVNSLFLVRSIRFIFIRGRFYRNSLYTENWIFQKKSNSTHILRARLSYNNNKKKNNQTNKQTKKNRTLVSTISGELTKRTYEKSSEENGNIIRTNGLV